jgi:hypothetical protein
MVRRQPKIITTQTRISLSPTASLAIPGTIIEIDDYLTLDMALSTSRLIDRLVFQFAKTRSSVAANMLPRTGSPYVRASKVLRVCAADGRPRSWLSPLPPDCAVIVSHLFSS